MSAETGPIKSRISRSEALQRHHDHYTWRLVTKPSHLDDFKQGETALTRRLAGEVDHLTTASGVRIVLDP
jgi:hypothetical protein